MHRHTPTLSVLDPRGAVVRDIAYHRRSDQQAPESRITQHIYNTANRVSYSRDPRLFARFEADKSTPANQATLTTLTGQPLLSVNLDAGWRLSLYGAARQRLEDWDQTLNHLRMTYDCSLRPEGVFEAVTGEEQRTACFAYGDDSQASARHNRCGQLIRHDDGAGTQHFSEFSLFGACLQQTRRFLAQLQLPDWPVNESERDQLLEPQGALTHIGFNSVGESVRLVDALGNEQQQRQSVAGELLETRIRLFGAQDEITLASDIRYNAFGQTEQQTAGNGVVTRSVFDPEDGRLITLQAQRASQPPLQHLTYAYDPVGNPIRITDAAQSIRYSRNQSVAAISTWEYDSLGQLVKASGRQRSNASGGPHLPAFVSPPDPGQLENYIQTFDYDAGGNLEILHHHADSASRTERTAVATLSNRSLPWGDGIESPGDSEIDAAYDACGNLNVLQRGQALHWDSHNRLRRVDQVVREDEPADTEIYIYDGDDQRVRKIRTAYTGTLSRTHETRYLPGVEVRTGPNEILHVINVQIGGLTVRVLHWQAGQPKVIAKTQLRYCLADHLGSSTLELDEDANIISQENFYAFGGTAWWAGRDKVEASYKTIRYSGKERDATGLYYYGFRLYMPWRQRWLNADPAGTIDGLNLYRMVGSNPVRFVDTHGLAGNDLSLMEQGGRAAQRTSTVQWVGARVADVVRGGAATATGELASAGVAILLETTAGSTLRGANAAISAVAHGYAGGGLAENYISNHRLKSRFATVPIRFTGYVLGAGVGAASGYLSPDPLGSLARTTSRAFEAGMSSFTSGVGPSIQYNTPSAGWSVVNLATGVLEGAYLPQISGLNPVLQGFITGGVKQTAGAAILRMGNVSTSYIPGSALSFPDREELGAGLKQLGHSVLMDITYSNSMDWVVVNLEGAGHESFAQTHPVADSILHTVNPLAELDPLIGQWVQSGYRQRAVDNTVSPRKFLATV